MDKASSKEILIVNIHSTLNLGDAALLTVNIQQLENAFPRSSFRLMVNYPNESFSLPNTDIQILASPFALIGAGTDRPGWVKVIKLLFGLLVLLIARVFPVRMVEKASSGWLRIAYAYRSSDIVAAVSGVQLLSLGKFSWPLIVSSIPIILAHYYHRPLYVMPQSLGPYRWKWEKRLVKELYSRARIVFVRDAISLKLAEEIGIPKPKIQFAYDPGLALPAASSEYANEMMSGYDYDPDQSRIGVTVISQLSKAYSPDILEHYYQSLVNCLEKFSETHHSKIYFFDQVRGPTSKEDDSLAVEALIQKASDSQGSFHHVERQFTPGELKACYGLMDVFIASRLHSGIFAMSMGVPTIFIGYNPKTRGFLESIGLQELYIDLNGMEEDIFLDLLLRTWENRLELSAKTRMVVNDCLKDFDRVSSLIYEDYHHGR